MPRRVVFMLYACRWRVVLYLLLALALAGVLLHGFGGWEIALKGVLAEAGKGGFVAFTVLYNILPVPFPYDPFLLAWAAWGETRADLMESAALATGGMLVAAVLDYAGGYWLRPRVEPWLRKQRGFGRVEAALLRYEIGAVALSAITPLPFSLVCWLAGILRMPLLPLLGIVAVTRLLRNVLVLMFFVSV